MSFQFQSAALEVVQCCIDAIVALAGNQANHAVVSKLVETAKLMLTTAQGTLGGTAVPATLEHCKVSCEELIASCKDPVHEELLKGVRQACFQCIAAI